MEYKATRPMSVCTCGHLGDGANSEHHDLAFREGGEHGHGACIHPDCDCHFKRFTWGGFTEEFQKFMKLNTN